MNKYTAGIEGMACGMCEAHIADTVRKVFPDAKKVKASRRKGTVEFVMEEEADEAALKAAIDETGYRFTGLSLR